MATCQGGPIAIEYAARRPERVNKLILYGTYGRGRLRWTNRPNEIEKGRVLLDLTRLGWGQENHAFLQVWARLSSQAARLSICIHGATSSARRPPAETAVRLLRIGWNVDVREAARKIKCPVLVIHPERDAVVPIEEGRSLASLIPNCRFVQLDTENHMPLADEPAWPRLVDEMRRFLAEPAADPPMGAIACRSGSTPRERAVLEGIAEGLDNTEIAASLGLSQKTVRNHITRVFDKIGVEHRYEAIVRAREAASARTERFVTSRLTRDTRSLTLPAWLVVAPGLRLKTTNVGNRTLRMDRAWRMHERHPEEITMPKFVIERDIVGAGKLPKEDCRPYRRNRAASQSWARKSSGCRVRNRRQDLLRVQCAGRRNRQNARPERWISGQRDRTRAVGDRPNDGRIIAARAWTHIVLPRETV